MKTVESQNDMSVIKKESRYLIAVLLIIFCIFQYGIHKICGFTLYPDEFGYWASAAKVVGYDWTEVASLGSYYSFGYSLILIPVLKLFSDGMMAYRAAVAVNMLLICISVFLLLKIAKRMCPEVDAVQRIFLCGIAVLYPPWLFYMQMTMTETLLCFLFLWIFHLVLCFLEKPGAVKIVTLAALFVYMYCVHMRTIAVMLAGIMILGGWGLANIREKKTKKLLALFFVVLILSSWVAGELKEWTIREVFPYAEKEALLVNDYGDQWRKLAQILTPKGALMFLQEVFGKLYYLGIASFGIFYWGLGWCVKESAGLVRSMLEKVNISLKQWGALFLLFATVGEVLVSSIYMYQVGKIDGLIYGRYNEFLVPAMLLLGVAVMKKVRLLFPVTFLLGIVTGGMTWMLIRITEEKSLEILRGYHVAGVSYLIQEDNLNSSLFFRNTWILGFIFMIFVAFLVWLSGRQKEREWIMTGIWLLEIMAGIQISHHYTYPVNNVNFESKAISDKIEEFYKESDAVVYLDEENFEFVDFLQMQMPDKSIHVIEKADFKYTGAKGESEGKLPGRFLITYRETKEDEWLTELYEKKMAANVFCLYYNRE